MSTADTLSDRVSASATLPLTRTDEWRSCHRPSSGYRWNGEEMSRSNVVFKLTRQGGPDPMRELQRVFEAAQEDPIQDSLECIAPGFLDSGLTVFASTLPRPARRGRAVPERGFGSRTSPASSARCTSA